VHENDGRFRPGVISDVDPVLVPLNKSFLVGHHSLVLNAASGASRMSATIARHVSTSTLYKLVH
jgi:hypothetical protein